MSTLSMDLFLVGSRDTLQVVVVNVYCDFIKLATVCALISRSSRQFWVMHIPIIPIEQ